VSAPSGPRAPQTAPLSESTALFGVRLVVAYDGSDFAGFQIQPERRSVQGALEAAVLAMTGEQVRVRGAGRTDAGVHALGQVVAFDTAHKIPERGWMLGLNHHLPDDVRIQSAASCSPGYQPRFDSVGKHYRYLIQEGEAKNPLLRRRAWQLGRPARLDVGMMREAAQQLVGTHDYRAFRAADDERENTTRTIWSIDLCQEFAGDPSLLSIDVRGTAFMKQMVRILSGTLVDVGRGRIPLARVPSLLGASALRRDAGVTAPAHGLTLVHVELGRQGDGEAR
jgi:tRNA pseudouridine38-40 synthase